MSESFSVSAMRDVSQRLIDQLTSSHTTNNLNHDDTNNNPGDLGTEAMTAPLTVFDSAPLNLDDDARSLRSRPSLAGSLTNSLTLERIAEVQRTFTESNSGEEEESPEEAKLPAVTEEREDATIMQVLKQRNIYLWLALLVWVLLALLIIVPTHLLLKWEADDCSSQCRHDNSEDLLTRYLQLESQRTLKTTFKDLTSLSYAITSQIESASTEWSYLFQPKYLDLMTNQAVEQEGSILQAVGYAPIVNTDEERDEWEVLSTIVTSKDTDKQHYNFIYRLLKSTIDGKENWTVAQQYPPGPYAPIALWQERQQPSTLPESNHTTTASSHSLLNFDLLSRPIFRDHYKLLSQQTPDEPYVLSDVLEKGSLPLSSQRHQSIVTFPVYGSLPSTQTASSDQEIKGLLFGLVSWDALLEGLQKHNEEDTDLHGRELELQLENNCGSTITWGPGSPESILSTTEGEQAIAWVTGNADDETNCRYRLGVYLLEMEGELDSGGVSSAIWFPVAQTFLFLVAAVGWYILLTEEVEGGEIDKEATTNHQPLATDDANASQVFSYYEIECALRESQRNLAVPIHLHRCDNKDAKATGDKFGPNSALWHCGCDPTSRKGQLLAFVNEVNKMAINHPIALLKSKPLADIFLETTILYADIARFTAWSSERDPTEIFRLLETIYQTFNEMAVSQGILTLDAIGDCYVAVSGISAEKQQHAVKMARFSLHAIAAMRKVTSALEIAFGPDTSKLLIRIGLHSAPVTLGVLRCAGRSRLQLFGQAVDVVSKMESTGKGGRVHISSETARLLDAADKSSWYVPREEEIALPGNEETCKTYWLVDENMDSSVQAKTTAGMTQTIARRSVADFLTKSGSFVNAMLDDEDTDDESEGVLAGDQRRLIDWNVDQMLKILKRLLAKRIDLGLKPQAVTDLQSTERLAGNSSVMDAVQEVIDLPKYWSANSLVDVEDIEVPEDVVSELYEFVTIVSTLYRKNPFHNFEHASHVVMTTIKLNHRIASQDGLWEDTSGQPYYQENSFSYIASDPLVQLSFIFAALIHDLDHDGVSNDQLVKEGARIARIYNNESVAEQNSYDIAIDLLMEPAYSSLRKVIFATEEEMKLFLQLTKQAVIATDVMSQKLRDLRNTRWETAFKTQEEQKCPDKETIQMEFNRKATIFIEHLIQASDVSHTMQHWHVFRKWNQKLFEEMYLAFKAGRSAKDPSECWYSGEIGFFDFYIIPLAKKLKNCGVFGVYSDEYLNNAQRNRNEWKLKGQEIVGQMLLECQRKINRRDGGEVEPFDPDQSTVSAQSA